MSDRVPECKVVASWPTEAAAVPAPSAIPSAPWHRWQRLCSQEQRPAMAAAEWLPGLQGKAVGQLRTGAGLLGEGEVPVKLPGGPGDGASSGRSEGEPEL